MNFDYKFRKHFHSFPRKFWSMSCMPTSSYELPIRIHITLYVFLIITIHDFLIRDITIKLDLICKLDFLIFNKQIVSKLMNKY